MKLGILVTIVSGFGKKGFYHSQELGLGKCLAEKGHEVHIYKCVPEQEKYSTSKELENLSITYVPVRKMGVHGYFPVKVLDTSLDGVLAFSDTQIFLPHVLQFCEKNKICFVPYIGIAHSFQKNMKSRVMDGLFSMGTLRYYRRMPVLAKTELARKELEGLGVHHCHVVPVGLDRSELKTDFLLEDRSLLRRQYGYEPSDVVLCFIARLKPEKRPLDLLRIFDRIKGKKPFKLLIIGEGPQRGEMDEYIRSHKLESDTKIIDRVPYDDIWKIHYISDYFLNLRHGEIFGMALMEGVFYQSSVAAMHGPGPDLILKGMEGHALCRDDEDVEKWLLKEFPAAEDLQRSADRLLDRFSWDHCADAFVRITTKYKTR